MMKKYNKHFMLDKETVKDYCVDYLKFFDKDDELESQEIGDGNINYVFKVYSKKTGKSIVVKQADKYLRSSGRPLDLRRNKIEAEILKIEGELAPNFVPKIYNYNQDMYALSMEDVSEYKNLRKELLNEKIFKHLAEDITTFLAKTLIPTTDLILDRKIKKERVQEFTNIELCDITEDLVLTEPYYDYKHRNIIIDGDEEFVKSNLYNDEQLKSEVGYLRNNFMNNAQSLIHGDLHSGSIFINEEGIKVIDPEFAFYGPMGYDIGNVIGNIFFTLCNKSVLNSNNLEFISYLKDTIIDIFDLTIKKIYQEMDKEITLPLYNHNFRENYIEKIKNDSIGYSGTEMIRRTVGDSKVAEITMVKNKEKQIILERILVTLGSRLIKERY